MQFKIKRSISTTALTNETFLTEQNDFLKISYFTQEQFLDRKNEIQVLKLLQQNNFVPAIIPKKYGFTPEGKFYSITKYYPQLKLLNAKKLSSERLKEIKLILEKLHKIKITNSQIKKFHPLNFWLNIKRQIHPPTWLTTPLPQLDDILWWITNYRVPQWVLCHSDLVINNLGICEGKIRIMDFEYTYLNDPLYDIASFIAEGLLDHQTVLRWLKVWNISPKKQKIIYQWTKYQNFKNVYWAILMFQITNKPVYQSIAHDQLMRYHDPFLTSYAPQ